MPIIGFIQVNLFRIPGHAVWKIPVALGLTLALGFASYQSLVRYTWLGTGLHGRRERPEVASMGTGRSSASVSS
jgi:hypothetical protein